MNDIINDIIEKTIGLDNDGKPKASINLTCFKYDLDSDILKENGNLTTYNPEIRIQNRDPYIQIDMIFKSDFDNDMRVAWSLFEKYGVDINNYDVAEFNVPIISLIIVPLSEEGKYYIDIKNPIFWVLQPDIPGGRNNMIRILCENDNVNFFETDEVDIDKVKADFEQEQATKDFIDYQRDKKEDEDQEYIDERNRKMEEMRKRNYSDNGVYRRERSYGDIQNEKNKE